jgi:hypothetical protein
MNRGSDTVLSVYSDARAEYTKQLCVFLVPAYFQFFIEVLEKSKQDMAGQPKRTLWQFQTYLNEVHDWNMEKVHNEIHRINTNCGCDYLEDLLTAVFIAHTKVLTAIRLSSNKKKIEINVPKVEHFLFKVLCETSKLLWSSTYLFRDDVSSIEKQQNYRSIEQIINEGILQAVRSLVPVKSILKDFVGNDSGGAEGEAEEEDESDDETEEKEVKDVKEEKIVEKVVEKEELNIPFEPVSISEPLTSDTILEQAPVTPIIPAQFDQVQTVTETKVEQQANPPMIVIDERPNVRFGEFDAVFDSDNPHGSDMIYDPKDGEEEVPALEILDEQGTSLAEGLDFDDLDERPAQPEDLGLADYEELN